MNTSIIIIVLLLCIFFFVILYFVRIRTYQQQETEARRELKLRAKQFTGYYQALYDCVNEKSGISEDKLLLIWEQRMGQEAAIMSYYNILRKKNHDTHDSCVELLKFIEFSGIIHDSIGDIRITEKQRGLYLFDDVYELGDIAVVLKPAWYFYDDTNVYCVEKGIAQIKE